MRSTISQLYFRKQLYIFRTDLLSIIRSLNTVFTVTSMTNTNYCEYSINTPDDGQYVCPKHVELFTKIKFRNSASCWLLWQEHIMMHGPLNVKNNHSELDTCSCDSIRYNDWYYHLPKHWPFLLNHPILDLATINKPSVLKVPLQAKAFY